MPIPRTLKGRFSAERLYAPGSIVVCGAETQAGLRVCANMQQAGFAGRLMTVSPASAKLADLADLAEAPDLAVLTCAPEEGAPALRAVAAVGTRAAIVMSGVANLRALAQETGIRILGPSSFGLAVPRLGINASLCHMAVPAGRVALLTQSPALARAIIDWAGPNGVGFSHISGVGGNVDLGFGVGLDWLARDPETKLILLDINRVRARRAFISAARAASRLRPVVAIRPGGALADPSGRSNAVFEAALSRAGVFVVQHLDELFAAAGTLTRSRPARGEALAIVTNALGPGRLAADAALSAGIRLATLPAEAQAALAASAPIQWREGLVYAGAGATTRVADIAAMLGAAPEVGGVLVLLAPAGPEDGAAIEAVLAAARLGPLPVLSCIMGETTGAAHRRRLAEAGLPAFATPEQAVQGFVHLLRARRAGIAARELPGRRVLEVAPDHDAVARVLEGARAARRDGLSVAETMAVLRAYGIAATVPGLPGGTTGSGAPGGATGTGMPDSPGDLIGAQDHERMSVQAHERMSVQVHERMSVQDHERMSVQVHDDASFGPAIGIAAAGGVMRYGLPPLNLNLALDLASSAGLHGVAAEAASQLLVRVSQLLVDEPGIGMLGLDPVWLGDAGAVCGNAAIWLRPEGEAAVLAIPPYPEYLSEQWESRGQVFTIRPIRPEDAQAHADMVRRVPPEDMRYRFFTATREVAPEQMARLTQIDYEREMAFIAVRNSDGATVGVSRLVREMGTPRGEFAIVVEPSAKGLGLAAQLMARIIGWGRSVGLGEIVGTVLADNHAMIGFVRHLGFVVRHVPDEADVVEVVLGLEGERKEERPSF